MVTPFQWVVLWEIPIRERERVSSEHFQFVLFVKHFSVEVCWINKLELRRRGWARGIKFGVRSIFVAIKPHGEIKSSSRRRSSDAQPREVRRLQEELGGTEIIGEGRNVGERGMYLAINWGLSEDVSCSWGLRKCEQSMISYFIGCGFIIQYVNQI